MYPAADHQVSSTKQTQYDILNPEEAYLKMSHSPDTIDNITLAQSLVCILLIRPDESITTEVAHFNPIILILG